MCGILGIVAKQEFPIVEALKRLKRLEYRGYDSAGFATKEGFCLKKVGLIDDLIKVVQEKYNGLKSNLIISHTRWATHGNVSDMNAHPHFDCNKEIFIVHNGTIDNYKEIRKELEEKGHRFWSETDSELFAHYFEQGIKEGKSIKEIVEEIFEKFEGTYAVLVIFKNQNKLIAIKNGSPLVMGIGEDVIFLASDVYAFLDKTQRVIVLDDYEWIEIKI